MTEFICKKCDELKAYNVVATADVNPEVVDSLGCTEWAGYDADEVDAVLAEKDAEIRRLQRALWMHRAITAKLNKDGCKVMREYNPFIGIEEYMWQEVERKCRAKAEQYK